MYFLPPNFIVDREASQSFSFFIRRDGCIARCASSLQSVLDKQIYLVLSSSGGGNKNIFLIKYILIYHICTYRRRDCTIVVQAGDFACTITYLGGCPLIPHLISIRIISNSERLKEKTPSFKLEYILYNGDCAITCLHRKRGIQNECNRY